MLRSLPLDSLATVVVEEGAPLYRCYDGTWGYDEFNPGKGWARFSPTLSASGEPVPTMYAAETEEAALLETVFHDVHQSADRLIYEASLRLQLLAHVRVPAPLVVVDLRDDALRLLGVRRHQIVSSSQEHYACTQRLAARLHAAPRAAQGPAHGIVWHSRQAELTGARAEVLVVFGDRYGAGRGRWRRVGPGSRSLSEGPGRLLVDALAERLEALVVTD